MKNWRQHENIVAHMREGDSLKNILNDDSIEYTPDSSGYRSIHYIVVSSPTVQEIKVEIQVRTLFQEGWCEIDHNLKYSKNSKDSQIVFCLDVFNMLAGTADAMGSYAKGLHEYILESKAESDGYQSTIGELQAKLKDLSTTKDPKKQAEILIAATRYTDDLQEQFNKLSRIKWARMTNVKVNPILPELTVAMNKINQMFGEKKDD